MAGSVLFTVDLLGYRCKMLASASKLVRNCTEPATATAAAWRGGPAACVIFNCPSQVTLECRSDAVKHYSRCERICVWARAGCHQVFNSSLRITTACRQLGSPEVSPHHQSSGVIDKLAELRLEPLRQRGAESLEVRLDDGWALQVVQPTCDALQQDGKGSC